jgi:phosphoglycerol transferase MdoB-like AlkP superfamily enzyme
MAEARAPSKRQRLVHGPRLLAGIVVAALAAGPVFFIAGTLLSNVIASPGGEVFGWVEGQALPFVLLLSVRYVFLAAILPVTLGATMMAVLGAMFRRARSWLYWMLAGLVLAGLICLLFPDLLSTFRQLGIALLITGAACGLICRAFAGWPEDADAADEA